AGATGRDRGIGRLAVPSPRGGLDDRGLQGVVPRPERPLLLLQEPPRASLLHEPLEGPDLTAAGLRRFGRARTGRLPAARRLASARCPALLLRHGLAPPVGVPKENSRAGRRDGFSGCRP